MKITVDTNILVRAIVRDDPRQSEIAAKTLRQAEILAVGMSCLCEFVWVLRRAYKFTPASTAAAIRELLKAANVETNRPAVEAGLATLDAGGDFADGVIAHEGEWLGAETFVSFDQKAVELLKAEGKSARLL
ncbi:MAG TPA: type II toxin-antitoxin system VapC family toxin [Terriglobales bacterium]|nr:type II toxin-antitoxin system VapC family toxin [Terriglobales bacterium]